VEGQSLGHLAGTVFDAVQVLLFDSLVFVLLDLIVVGLLDLFHGSLSVRVVDLLSYAAAIAFFIVTQFDIGQLVNYLVLGQLIVPFHLL
jgi:hypothetical protein